MIKAVNVVYMDDLWWHNIFFYGVQNLVIDSDNSGSLGRLNF